ncbi:radical SAM protein [Dehalococcoidia bacterium]|nr:radical SAM protein [Dehalococcoidia bacterium]
MAPSIGRGIMYRTKRELAERALGQALSLLGNNPDKNARYLISAIDHIARGEKQGIIGNWIRDWLAEGKPGREFLSRILKNTHPNVRRRFIARMLVSMLFRDPEVGERCMQEYGITPPYTMLISPSMRCNYRCQGCYAASYKRKDDMRPEVFDRLLSEAEHIGINFFAILGGEPFIYPELLDILSRHNRSFFQIYTNGSFIDKAMAKRLVEMGNIAPQMSVNGPAEYTDASRGKGSFDRVMQAMDDLREVGCIFGFSTLVTRHNIDAVCSEEWIDLLIAKGALYGWLFLYMPVGGNSDMSLMPTPRQRNQLRLAMRHYRQTKPILPVDFWNDGTVTGGCIAGGRLYFHINHRGDVEPCIFCHFATHSINDCSLAEALASPFFMAIKEQPPFSYNTLRPCPIIDHPQTMWSIIQQHGARPTHEGAEKMFTTFAAEMQEYSAGVREILDAVWDNEDYHDWAPRWTLMCGIPPARLEARRREYEMSSKSQ